MKICRHRKIYCDSNHFNPIDPWLCWRAYIRPMNMLMLWTSKNCSECFGCSHEKKTTGNEKTNSSDKENSSTLKNTSSTSNKHAGRSLSILFCVCFWIKNYIDCLKFTTYIHCIFFESNKRFHNEECKTINALSSWIWPWHMVGWCANRLGFTWRQWICFTVQCKKLMFFLQTCAKPITKSQTLNARGVHNIKSFTRMGHTGAARLQTVICNDGTNLIDLNPHRQTWYCNHTVQWWNVSYCWWPSNGIIIRLTIPIFDNTRRAHNVRVRPFSGHHRRTPQLPPPPRIRRGFQNPSARTSRQTAAGIYTRIGSDALLALRSKRRTDTVHICYQIRTALCRRLKIRLRRKIKETHVQGWKFRWLWAFFPHNSRVLKWQLK